MPPTNLKGLNMTRVIKINGKTVTLETGKTAPARKRFGRPKSDLRLLLEAMRPGESVFLQITSDAVQRFNIYNVSKAVGVGYTFRAEGDGVRIYCTEPKPAKPSGAARSRVAPIKTAQQAWA